MRARQPQCILVVADEPVIRHMACRLLASQGYWAVAADGGERDFDTYSALPLALVLVNTYLPDLDGNAAVDRVKSFFPGVPVLHMEQTLRGGNGFDVDDLLSSVRTLTRSERRLVPRGDEATA
jgi:CheY-like chemotaxis protein